MAMPHHLELRQRSMYYNQLGYFYNQLGYYLRVNPFGLPIQFAAYKKPVSF